MKPLLEYIKQIYEYSGKTIQFINRNFGLRPPSAEPLDQVKRRSFYRAMKFWGTLLVLSVGFYGYILWYVRGSIDSLIDAASPIDDLRKLYSDWRWAATTAYATAGMILLLALWANSLRKDYGARKIFVFIPVCLALSGFFFQPIARLVVERRLLAIFNKGLSLWDKKEWENCYLYYSRIYKVFPNCFISDNSLGRMAGAKYWATEYSQALENYAALLSRFPDTDIIFNARQSLRWTMASLGENCPAETCAAYYRINNLQQLGFSAFAFFLEEPPKGEAGDPRLFGSITMHPGTENQYHRIDDMLDSFPDDVWAARAAFLIGSAQKLARYTNSPYFKASGVVEAWHLQNSQQYAEASKRYEEYLRTSPAEPEADNVRKLLVSCYLASEQIENALTNIIRGARDDQFIPSENYHFLLDRFAFLNETSRAKQLFETYHAQLPIRFSIDMDLILRERLTLEESSDAAILQQYEKYARRSALLGATPVTPSDFGDVGRLIAENFSYGTNLISFVNSRLGQTKQDPRHRHLLDRFYDFDSNMWPDAGRTSFTELLTRYAERHSAKLLRDSPTVTSRLNQARNLVTKLEDPSIVDEVIKAYLDGLVEDGTRLDVSQLRVLRDFDRESFHTEIEALCIRALQLEQSNGKGLSNGLAIFDLFPTTTNLTFVQNIVTQMTQNAASCEQLEQMVVQIAKRVRNSPRRTLLMPALTESVMNGFVGISTEPSKKEKAKSYIRAWGLDALRDKRTYPVASAAFSRYLQLWPDDNLQCNVQLWLAWLACFEANENVRDPLIFTDCYGKALNYYDEIGRVSKQQKIRIIALESARRIRRKLRAVETGRLKPQDLPIPQEILIWGDPRLRLENTTWFVAKTGDEKLVKIGEVSFTGKTMAIDISGTKTSLEYELNTSNHEHFDITASGEYGDGTIIINASINAGAISINVLHIHQDGHTTIKRCVGNLAMGNIAKVSLDRNRR